MKNTKLNIFTGINGVGKSTLHKILNKNCFGLCIETLLYDSSILNLLKETKEKGIFIELFYVGLASLDIAVERVQQREQKGGHGINAELVEKRYENSQENLKLIFDLCDVVHFYDNTVSMNEVCFIKGNKIVYRCNMLEWDNNSNLCWVKNLVNSIYENLK